MFTISQYSPKFAVTVYTKKGGVFNLTNDIETITTSKSISQSAGTFTLNISGRKLYGIPGIAAGSRWSDVIRPLDYIEISAATNRSSSYSIIMRGIVNNPNASVTFGPTGGPPEPMCVISGTDTTYLLLMWQVIYMWTITAKGALAEGYGTLGLYLNFGFDLYESDFKNLVKQFKTKMGDPVVKAYQSFISQFPGYQYLTAMQNNVGLNLMTVNAQNGSYWNLLQYYASPPFGECFVQDFDDAPYIVTRFPPYTDISGVMQNPSTLPPAIFDAVSVSTANIRNYQLGRSDENQFTYFFSYGDASQVKNLNLAVFASQGGVTIDQNVASATGTTINSSTGTGSTDNPIWAPAIGKLYGARAYMVDTPLIQIYDLGAISSSTVLSTKNTNTNFQQEAVELNSWLYHVMKDNAEYVQGTMEVEGSPDYKVGRNIEISEWAETYYISGVQHSISGPGSAEPDWSTQLTIVRGRLSAGGSIPIIEKERKS